MAYENPDATPHPQSALYEASFRENSRRLLGQLIVSLNDLPLAEDVLQGTYLKSLAITSFDPKVGTPMGYWLSVESKRVAIDMNRSNNSREARERLHGGVWSEAIDYETPESTYLDREQALGFHAAIRQLSEVQQRVILLELEGYTQLEIAKLCNVPLGTVKGRMRDGKIRLRNLLSTSEDEAA